MPYSSGVGIRESSKVVAAIPYSEIPRVVMGKKSAIQATLKSLPTQASYDSFAEIKPSEADKELSSQNRASRRAYNGAPPIIPHSIQNTNDAACYACHSNGMQMAGLKASVMSHQFLANCTQCHASPPPAPFQTIDSEVATNFVGLPAPKAGQRAYSGAPPTIPHSQWMRQNCLACHGSPNGWAGMESTHPWRTNCTQCHAPSAVLDQAIPVESIPMLPPLNVANR
jgi:cytochrome c-type protein NapB